MDYLNRIRYARIDRKTFKTPITLQYKYSEVIDTKL